MGGSLARGKRHVGNVPHITYLWRAGRDFVQESQVLSPDLVFSYTAPVELDTAGNLESAIDQAMAQGELDRAEMLAQEYRAAAAGDSAAGLSPRFRSCYLSARVAFAAGRIEMARERLSELLPLPVEIPTTLACRIELMFAEV